MPCICCNCGSPCGCDEICCERCLTAALNNERLETDEDDNQEKKDC